MQDIRRRESGRHNDKIYRETFARETVVENEHACHGGTRSMRTSHRWMLITEPCNFFDHIGFVHHRYNTVFSTLLSSFMSVFSSSSTLWHTLVAHADPVQVANSSHLCGPTHIQEYVNKLEPQVQFINHFLAIGFAVIANNTFLLSTVL